MISVALEVILSFRASSIIEPERPRLSMTLIVAMPGASAVTCPFWSTEIIELSELAQLTTPSSAMVVMGIVSLIARM